MTFQLKRQIEEIKESQRPDFKILFLFFGILRRDGKINIQIREICKTTRFR